MGTGLIPNIFHYYCLILPPDSTSSCGLTTGDQQNDDYCDDENNNSGCNWDGGACCGDNVKKNYCYDCECLDPNFQGMFLFISVSGTWFLYLFENIIHQKVLVMIWTYISMDTLILQTRF